MAVNRGRIARSRKPQTAVAKTASTLTQRQRARIKRQRAKRREIGNYWLRGALSRGRLTWHALDTYSDILIPKHKVKSPNEIRRGDVLLIEYSDSAEIGKYIGKGTVEVHHTETNRIKPPYKGTTEINFNYHLAGTRRDLNFLLTRPAVTVKKIQIQTRKGPLPR